MLARARSVHRRGGRHVAVELRDGAGAEKQRPLELGLAPRHPEIMPEEHPAQAVDDRMGDLESAALARMPS